MEAGYILGLLYVLILIYNIWLTLDNIEIARNILLVFNHEAIRKLITRTAVNAGIVGATSSLIIMIFLRYPILYAPHIVCIGLSMFSTVYAYYQARPVLRLVSCPSCIEESHNMEQEKE